MLINRKMLIAKKETRFKEIQQKERETLKQTITDEYTKLVLVKAKELDV